MLNTLIVGDDDTDSLAGAFPDVIDFATYLRDFPRKNEPRTRIINLCDTEHYLSRGYYCSLLAEARRHRVLPELKTINELRSGMWTAGDFPLITADTRDVPDSALDADHFACFGQSTCAPLQKLAARSVTPVPGNLKTAPQYHAERA